MGIIIIWIKLVFFNMMENKVCFFLKVLMNFYLGLFKLNVFFVFIVWEEVIGSWRKYDFIFFSSLM